jgi:hypothetical protein
MVIGRQIRSARRRALVCVLLGLAPGAVTLHAAGYERRVESLPFEQAPLRLIEPRDGSRLTAGSVVRLAWRWRAEVPSCVEEWEAFLSFDGGQTYSLRATPHLDLDRQEFGLQVPAVASRDVRVMIRFGDEREEFSVEFPDRFEIVADHASAGDRWRATPEAATRRRDRPRRGDHPVNGWAEGPRDGSRWWWVEVLPNQAAGRDARWLRGGATQGPFLRSDGPRNQESFEQQSVRSVRPERDRSAGAEAHGVAFVRHARAASCRRNE